MEDNRPNQDLTNQDIEFIKEKVKERPLNRRKLFKKTLLTASMAAIFGLIACVTFLVLEPVFSNLLYPEEEPQQVELKEEKNIEDEMRPEDMILEEETETETTTELQTVVEKSRAGNRGLSEAVPEYVCGGEDICRSFDGNSDRCGVGCGLV